MRYIDNCKCKEIYQPKHQYIFSGPCVITKEIYSVTIEAQNLFNFRQSDNVMELGLNEDDREFVMTGISPKGWEILFKED